LFDSQSTTQLEFRFQTLDEIDPSRRQFLDLKLVAHHDALGAGHDRTFKMARVLPVRLVAATSMVANRAPSATFPVPSTFFRRWSVERLAVQRRAPQATVRCNGMLGGGHPTRQGS